MNGRVVLMGRLLILWIVSVMYLAGCGGRGSTSQSVNRQPPPPSPPTAVTVGSSPFHPAPSATLLIRDTPPNGVAVLSFSVTVTGAVMEPGDVSLVTNPVSVELNRLQVETALLANLTIPSGTYTSLTVTFANPVLTILNNSGVANSSCPSGAICRLSPSLAVSSVHFTEPPFPVIGDAFVMLLDFDLSKSLSNLGTLNPVVTLRQLTPADLSQGAVSVKQVAGKIIYVAGDSFCCGAFFDLLTDMGPVNSVDDSLAHYVDAIPCGSFFCVQDKIAEVDLTLPSGGQTFWEAKRVTLKSPDLPELEGVIVGINGDTQFDIALLHQVPSVAGLEMGDLVRINLQSGAAIEAVDANPRSNGLLFSAPSDLLVGQVVTARTRSAPPGTPPAVTADRVRLKSGAFTARVKSILNADNFIVDSLPGNFPSAQIQVSTSSNTGFTNVAGLAALNPGDTVSFSGFLLKTTGTPVLLAEGVRKR